MVRLLLYSPILPPPRRLYFYPCLSVCWFVVGLSAGLNTDFQETWMEEGCLPEQTPITFAADREIPSHLLQPCEIQHFSTYWSISGNGKYAWILIKGSAVLRWLVSSVSAHIRLIACYWSMSLEIKVDWLIISLFATEMTFADWSGRCVALTGTFMNYWLLTSLPSLC